MKLRWEGLLYIKHSKITKKFYQRLNRKKVEELDFIKNRICENICRVFQKVCQTKKIFQNLLEMRGKAKCISLLFLQLYKVTWQTFLALVYFRFLGSYKVETQKKSYRDLYLIGGGKKTITHTIHNTNGLRQLSLFFFHRILLFS